MLLRQFNNCQNKINLFRIRKRKYIKNIVIDRNSILFLHKHETIYNINKNVSSIYIVSNIDEIDSLDDKEAKTI